MDWSPFPTWVYNPTVDGILRKRKVAATTPLPGWNGKHSANYNALAVCQGNATLRIAVDKPHRAVAPCRVKRQRHTETAMSSELLLKLHILEDCRTRTTANWITNIKRATTASKSRQGKTSTKPLVRLRAFRSLTNLCTVRSRLLTQWQARLASNDHSSQTDKPEPTSDALGALVGKNALMTQVQGKSWSHW